MSATKTRRQSVNFLGFLRGQLSGLSGIPTLCYELIQNADDVKDKNNQPGGATRISFDVCDDVLWVENDGVFRDIDFNRMEQVSWGDKREEADTTGSFGIGFISVYQVTDSPEIFSSGEHWRFLPQDQTIEIEELKTEATRFRLPWAFEISQVRQELNIPPVMFEYLDAYAKQLIQSIEDAALFLKQVRVLEVKRNGDLLRRIEVLKDGNELLLDDGEQTIQWKIINGSFEFSAGEMRRKHGDLIEKKRTSDVKLAIPEKPLDNGLLYAFLPSETHTGLPFHINADFYPSPDRKRILFDQDFRSDWNRLAIESVAHTLSVNLDDVLSFFSPPDFWEFAEHTKTASESSILNAPFGKLWEQLKPIISSKETILTFANALVIPKDSYFIDPDPEADAANIFEDLNINTVHPNLRKYRNILIDTNVQLLKVSTVGKALHDSGLSKRTALSDMPQSLQNDDAWALLWHALNSLWERASQLEKSQTEPVLKESAIAFGSDGELWPPAKLFTAEEKTRTLFSMISDLVWFDQKGNDEAIPNDFVPAFDLEAGIKALETVQDLLPEFWEEAMFSPREIYEWLEHHPEAKYLRDVQRERIRKLNIWPTADGKLGNLEDLFLPGGFEDPLKMTQFVDVELLGGGREFLHRNLGVSSLEFITYAKEWVPSVIQSEDLSIEQIIKLLEIMALHLGEMQGDYELQQLLGNLELVWCGNDQFCSGIQSYFDSPVVHEVLGDDAEIASIPERQSEAIRALYDWLGVSKEPNPKDVTARILHLTSTQPTTNKVQSIQTIFDFLASNWIHWDEDVRLKYRELQQISWLPGTKSQDQWYKPFEIDAVFQRFLFKSQGNFLVVDVNVQRKAGELIRYLGINREPNTEQVVRHLLFCSSENESINPQVYTHLSRNAEHPSIKWLLGKSCLYLETVPGTGKYYSPDQVYWEQHHFGQFRFRLAPKFGEYKPLFDQLEVKESPTHDDAFKVLDEISKTKFAQSSINISDDPEIEQVSIACWKILSEALESGDVSASKILNRLKKKKTIPNSERLLYPPEWLFVEDRPGWGENFTLLKGNLIEKTEGAWPAMEAAGVRRVSKAVETALFECEYSRQDDVLHQRLFDRKELIHRVIENYRQRGIKGFSLVDELGEISFTKADQLEIVRSFHGFGKREDYHENVDAICIDRSLYFCPNNGRYPWISIARELSYILHDSGELSSLGMELKEILSPDTSAQASQNLDQFGYPRVRSISGDAVLGQTIGGFGDSESDDDVWDDTTKDFPNETPDISPPTGEPPHMGDPGKDEEPDVPTPPKPPRKPKRKSTRLVSYVNPEEATSDKESDPSIAQRYKERGQKGVDFVLKFEKEQGRDATDMETEQINHPGFDVKSIDPQNPRNIRYIEVKSTAGLWDSANPAQMHKTQFETAQERGESYWLYVVEQVESDNPKIYCIRNPANRVDTFMFDHGWQPLADAIE